MIWSKISIFILGLAITIALEILVVLLFKFSRKSEIKVVALASLITYPVLNVSIYIYDSFYIIYKDFFIIFMEIIVVISEYIILKYVFGKRYGWKKLLLISFTMNFVSYLFGEFIFIPILL